MHVFDERVRLMRHWADQLRQRQVQLLVVAVPDKSRIEADRFCGLPASQPMRRVLDDWQRALQAQGVPFVDLRPALSGAAEPMFFRTDVHMNAQGAQAAARRVADAALPLLGGVGQQAFRVDAPGAPAPRMGDLIVLAGLEHARMGWRPELERVAPQQIEPLRSGGLLDEAPPVEVLLAGSSNGRRSHFAERLGMGLGREIWNLSLDGGQFSGALLLALKQREQWPKSLKLVVWEFRKWRCRCRSPMTKGPCWTACPALTNRDAIQFLSVPAGLPAHHAGRVLRRGAAQPAWRRFGCA